MKKYILITLLLSPFVVKADEIELKYYMNCRFSFIQQQITTGNLIDIKYQQQFCTCLSREVHKGYPYTNSKREESAISYANETCTNRLNFFYENNTNLIINNNSNEIGDQ